MKVRILLLAMSWLVVSAGPVRAVTNEPVRVFMPDGQIKSHLLRVYITEDIAEADKPTLTLLAGQFLLESLPSWAERTNNSYRELARFQHWTENENGLEVSHTGTLLIFDLRKADFPFFKACMRVTPVVKWGQPIRAAIGDQPVYVGNMIGATIWTALIVGAAVLAIFRFTRSRTGDVESREPAKSGGSEVKPGEAKADLTKPGFEWLLLNPEGRLSLSKTQAAVWTLCIGFMVFTFGLTRLAPPWVPETLVALMGLSLATRVVTYTQEKPTKRKYKPELSDLIRSQVGAEYALSITKAQMLYWTCLLAGLFVLKSLLDGELWDVPWQLVALMGISQATYTVPVVKKKTPADSGDPPEPGHGGGGTTPTSATGTSTVEPTKTPPAVTTTIQ
jgi:hypothetical protein